MDLSDYIKRNINSLLPADTKADRLINHGGQAIVFKGTSHLGDIAIKCFRFNDKKSAIRLKRELSFLHESVCNHLIKALDYFSISTSYGDIFFVVYPFFKNGDCRNYFINNNKSLEAGQLYKLIFQMIQAIKALWKERIIHRDIKPDNILIEDDFSFVLSDIGVAKFLDKTVLTAPLNTLGTKGYMSPEQASAEPDLTVTSDLFSLGVTLYELTTLSHPFNGQQPIRGYNLDYIPIENYRKDISPIAIRSIYHMLNTKPFLRSSLFRMEDSIDVLL